MLHKTSVGLANHQRVAKRLFDVVVGSVGLLLTGWIIVIAYVLATVDTKRNGFFVQDRIGRNGNRFRLIKIRTMREVPGVRTTITAAQDPRITAIGRFLRKTKIDELPQLINVVMGRMSFVGPRPDVPGYADRLKGDDRIVLSVRPGITGPATLKFRNEEELLAQQSDPEQYNRHVLYPEKTRINRDYVENYSFWRDVRYLFDTVFHTGTQAVGPLETVRTLKSGPPRRL